MYANWNEKDRSILRSFRFIERCKFIWTIQSVKSMNYASEDGRSDIRRALSFVDVHKKIFSKNMRFPDEDCFINIDDPSVGEHYDEALKGTMLNCSSDLAAEKENFFDSMKTILKEVTKDDSPSVYCQKKFENLFNLRWNDGD